MALDRSASVFDGRVQSLQVRRQWPRRTGSAAVAHTNKQPPQRLQEAVLEGVTTDNASAVVATARALSRGEVSASWVATAEACSLRLPLWSVLQQLLT